jgi:hypothetical protein
MRVVIFAGLMAIVTAGLAQAQTPPRPAIGGIGSPPDAMIFYVAHGAAGSCGQDCADWIAAEGTVQFDTHKRLIAILDRQAGRKLPVVIHSWGQSNLNVATSLGGVHRGLPPGTRVVLSNMFIRNRLAPNVSDEQRESLTARFGEQFRMYLRDMGVEPELLDIIDRNPEPRRGIELPPAE